MKLSRVEIDAVIAASPRIIAPFNKLTLSKDRQVRPSGSTSNLSIAELAASIKVSGVLQNLVVIKGQRGMFEAVAGGRRLEALTVLVCDDDIPDKYPVPVLVVPADKALLASLAKNSFHEPLHISAELEGMARLIAEGKSVEDMAAAFGVTPLLVKRRLKLAAEDGSDELVTQQLRARRLPSPAYPASSATSKVPMRWRMRSTWT